MTPPEELEDFQRELKEKEAIRKLPWNGLSIHALMSIKQSEISKRIEKHYEKMNISEFLNHTGKKQ